MFIESVLVLTRSGGSMVENGEVGRSPTMKWRARCVDARRYRQTDAEMLRCPFSLDNLGGGETLQAGGLVRRATNH
jgi:hypothetical protein